MRIVARPARVSVCKEAAPHLLELMMRRHEPCFEVFVQVEESPGTAAVEVLTTPFPLRNIDGTST